MSLRRALLLASFSLALAPQPSAGIDWVIETVDTDGDAGYRGSLALDSRGIPHIIYMEPTGLELRYATKTGATWEIEVVHEGWDGRAGLDAIILPGDIPAFATGGALYVRTGQIWEYEIMDAAGFWCSVVTLGPDGTVYAVSQGAHASQLGHGWLDAIERHDGTWSSPVWLMNTVFWPYDPNASIALDANENPHVSITTTNGDPLRYLHREGGVWSVDELGQGTWSSIAVDSHGSPRIAFYDPVALDLVMATRSNNTWTMTPIDQAHDVGLHPSQVIYNDVSYISYYEHTHGALMYGAFTSPNSFSHSLIDYSTDVKA